MSFKNVPIPAAAEAAGMTKLVFSEDFETEMAIDFSGEGKPGYSFYADRPYGGTTLTPEECRIEDSVLYFKPIKCAAAIGLGSYSKAGRTGFTMHYGYAEARIRAKQPTGEYNGVPAFWGIGLKDFLGQNWTHCGELDILEIVVPHTDKDKKIYTGTLHNHYRSGERTEQGHYKTVFASSSVVATGYEDKFDFLDDEWHTYAALWEPGHIAWYLDGKLMHSARFAEGEIPQYYYRDDPTPVKRLQEVYPNVEEIVWPGAHTIMNEEEEVIILGCNYNWPMEVDWVRIWNK